MFSMNDFETASRLETTSIERAILFSMSKNPVSYSLSLLKSRDRGIRVEAMIANKLIFSGFSVKRVGDHENYDLLVNDTFRVEVKCATYAASVKQYKIQKVKPEFFDILFMVFVAPDRQEIRWSTSEMVLLWTQNKSRTEQGYDIVFNKTMNNRALIYNDNYHSFVAEYSQSISC